MSNGGWRSAFDLVSREQLSNFLAQAEAPLELADIAEHFGYQRDSEIQALQGRLRAMTRDGQLIINRSSAYGLPKKMNLVRGIVGGTDRSGFGTLLGDDGGEYLLSRNQMLHLLSSDVIIARLGPIDKDHGKRFASLVEFVQRPSFVGRVRMLDGSVFVRTLKRHVPDIWVQSPPADLVADELVQVRVNSNDRDSLRGSIIERYGDRGSAVQEAHIALANNSIAYDFDEETLAEASKARAQITTAEHKRRVDLRELALCTIDGADARDFDDAVYAETSSQGYRLVVAIADVSHYVKAKSALDNSAQERGTSVYFPALVAPMLPERLSNDLCSLRPDEDRLALIVEMSLNDQAQLCSWRFANAVIRSQARLEYLQAQSLLDNTSTIEVPPAVFVSLRVLQEIYQKRAHLREQRGALEIDSYSAEFALSDQGQVEAITKSRRVTAHKLIEEMMLLANEAAATCLHQHAIPGLYRIHPAPDAQATAELSSFLRAHKVKVSASKLKEPKQYARLAQNLAKKPMAELLQVALLRSMSQARYSSSSGLHFGLNYDFYTHFTSPIRRYPDLLVHRQIKSAIAKAGDALTSEQQLPSKVTRPSLAQLQRLARQQSFLERRAESASREAADALKCHYLKGQIGATFEGIVAQVTPFGLFVGLHDLPIDGLVHVSSLKSDYYNYDPQSLSLRGRHSRKTYALGMPVTVQLSRVDVDKRRVDLRLCE